MKFTPLFAATLIPLGSPNGWQNLSFANIKPNLNTFSSSGLEVAVAESSSPLIYSLPQPVLVQSFRADLEIEGSMAESKNFPEDMYLRLGLVVPGSRTLNLAQRMMAAEWVKKLFALAPKDGGVDKIHFFNLGSSHVGQSRTFPGSKDLMVETVVMVRQREVKSLVFEHQLKAPLTAMALWLSVDGDDSRSNYKLRIRSLQLN